MKAARPSGSPTSTHQRQISRYDYETRLGEAATARLQDPLNDGTVELTVWLGRDEDQYGRKLRVVMRHGQSLGVLVSEDLRELGPGDANHGVDRRRLSITFPILA